MKSEIDAGWARGGESWFVFPHRRGWIHGVTLAAWGLRGHTGAPDGVRERQRERERERGREREREK